MPFKYPKNKKTTYYFQKQKIGQAPDYKSINLWLHIVSGAIIIFSIAIRIHFLSMPLERDEGEYAYIARLIMEGIPPYLKAYSMKMPGIYFMYAIVMKIFGQTVHGIHLGVFLFWIINTVLVFLISRNLIGPEKAIISAGCFAFLSVSLPSQSVPANAEHFVLTWVLISLLFLFYAQKSGRFLHFFLSGLFMGVGFTVKQHAIFFIFFALFLIILEKNNKKFNSLFLFLSGSIIPFFLICLYMIKNGAFTKFWFWTFTYASKYATYNSLSEGLRNFNINFGKIFNFSLLIWLFFISGIILTAKNSKNNPEKRFIILLTIFSVASVFPGLHFRPHYFILTMPAISIVFSISINLFKRVIPVVFLIAWEVLCIHSEHIFLEQLQNRPVLCYMGSNHL